MIPARKKPLVEWVLSRYIDLRLRWHFSAIRIFGLDELRQAVRSGPTLIVANHTAWWDSMLFLHLSKLGVGMDSYAMMNADNLRRTPILAAIGGFGVNIGDKADGALAVAYSASLLDRPGRVVLIFPQGRERPNQERPLNFRDGACRIAAAAGSVRILPCALRYEHRQKPRPQAFISFGSPCEANTQAMEAAVITEMDRISTALIDASIDSWSPYLSTRS